MTKFLTELQEDIYKVEGYIEKKQEAVDAHKLAMENAEKDLANLKKQLKELQDEQDYRVEFAKWKEEKLLEPIDGSIALEDKNEDIVIKRRGTKE